ncbi:S8 family serine peptidase [Amycolatopsis thermophila]|uniref:Subtilisin family serine protease n=1 Tax=Amycolatopsis thermophila TaxID=206084 RepID=A0ABU0EPB6_9PSEU|nr:S8 family serine peptidase [Amycolatopsis thermophila]MDQ0376825.1 subtilisin family serine protease [Amycolatopsis thermophila]
MRNRTRRSLAAVFTAALATTGFATGSAAAQDEPPAPGLPTAKVSADGLQGKLSPRLAASRGRTTAFVELTQQPAVDAFNAERGAGKDRAKQAANNARDAVAGVVNSVVGQLRSADAGTEVLYSTANAVSGVVVTADAAKIRELAARPDVASIRTVVPKTRSNNSTAQLTNTLNAWQQTGRLGDGVRVGVIDDGIDYTHADFGGPGTKAAYDSVDRAAPTPLFPNAKVVGGTDLVGDGYDAATDGADTPKPDPNPIACGEHGTHVAGTVAGYGVNADGSTFTGDYSKLTADSLNAMKIGPGMAPKASLYAIKVFGCAGSTNVTSQALDWALDPNGDGDFDDHLDIVNLSLGSDFGAPDDPDSLFVRKLAANNVLSVIAEGNGGDLYDVGGSPGNTPEALTVASSRDISVLRDAADVTAPGDVAGPKGGQYSQSYAGYDTLDTTAPAVKLSAANADGCAPFSDADKAAVAGRFAWLEWDDNDATRVCGSAARANNAQAAGAKGVLLSSSLEHFAAGIAGNSAIPMFQFTASATGQIRPALNAGTLAVRLYGAGRASLQTYDPAIVDTPSSFTSRGVRGPAVKPDVSAPGDTISSALRGSGNDRTVLSGTSMATPLTSGVTALLRQAHPEWSVEEIKALVMNTAGHDIVADGKTYAPQRVGAGRLDTQAALNDQVLAYSRDDRGAVSVTFGTVEVSKPVTLTKTIQVVNKGDSWARYNVAYEGITNLPGVQYQLSDRSVTVAPHGTATVRVTLRITDPTALRKVIDPTVATEQAGLARQFVADASGRVVLTPLGGFGTALRVPVYSAPKPVSAIGAPKTLDFQADTARFSLTGRGVDQGTGSQRYESLISVLELQGQSPKLPECRGRVTEGCTINDTAKGGDLQYVGAASNIAQARQEGHADQALLAFGISTWGNWANLGSNTIPFVDIDTSGDGKPDFESYVTKPSGTDVWLVNTVDLNAQGFPTVDVQAVNGQLGDVDTNVFDTNVVLLPVSIAALGIDPNAASHKISYAVGTAGYYVAPGSTNGLIDSIDTAMTFDALAPGYSVSGANGAALVYSAKPGTALTVTRNPQTAQTDTVLGLLALEHHNGNGDRVSVIRVNGGSRP